MFKAVCVRARALAIVGGLEMSTAQVSGRILSARPRKLGRKPALKSKRYCGSTTVYLYVG